VLSVINASHLTTHKIIAFYNFTMFWHGNCLMKDKNEQRR